MLSHIVTLWQVETHQSIRQHTLEDVTITCTYPIEEVGKYINVISALHYIFSKFNVDSENPLNWFRQAAAPDHLLTPLGSPGPRARLRVEGWCATETPSKLPRWIADVWRTALSETVAVSQFGVCIHQRSIWRPITSLGHAKAVPIRGLLQMQLTNVAFFSLFLEDAPLLSFVASHIPRFFAAHKRIKKEKMATSCGVDRHFRRPGQQKLWSKGKTPGDATRKCSKV